MKLKAFLLQSIALALLFSISPVQAETVLRYTNHEPLSNMRTKVIKDLFFAAIAE